MSSRRRPPAWALPFAAAAVCAVTHAPEARAAAQFTPCHGSSGVRCASVAAPFDYSGTMPGEIPLAVEKLQAHGRERGIMLLVAGGPGQASAKVFDLAHNRTTWQTLFPGYTLVAYDDRGTGGSGPLTCPDLPDVVPSPADDPVAAYVTACADALGPSRAFYATRDHAEDIETVRTALGVDRLFLWGVSYGTKQVLAYALAHPDHVQRLLLDSVEPPDGPDAFGGDMLRGIPAGMASLCSRGACRAATSDPVGDVVRLAERLTAKPIALRYGGHSVASLDGLTFLKMVIGSDLNAGLAAELPAAVSAALSGRPEPLKRLALFGGPDGGGSDAFNFALDLATTCGDASFPWGDVVPAERQPAIDAAIAALPAGATGPFGSWAAALGTSATCRTWPSPTVGAPLAEGPLPDVPVLVLAGDRDMRTPLAGARAVASAFPRAQLLVVPGMGHSVLTEDYSLCALRGVWAWLDGKHAKRCAHVPLFVPPLPAFPASVAATAPAGANRGLPGRTLAAVRFSLREAQASWLATGAHRLPGLYGGSLTTVSDTSFRLRNYSVVPGLSVSGSLTFTPAMSIRMPSGLRGRISVSGSGAAHGTLHAVGTAVWGRLAHRDVLIFH